MDAHEHAAGRGLALAIDIGGTKVAAALVDGGGRVVPGSEVRRATGAQTDEAGLARNIASAVHGALAARPDGVALVGVGIGSAGPVDLARGAISPKNLRALDGFPVVRLVEQLLVDAHAHSDPSGSAGLAGRSNVPGLAGRSNVPGPAARSNGSGLADRFGGLGAAATSGVHGPGVPVVLRLDGTCIALAEQWRGATRGDRHSLALVVSTGVGGGIVSNGVVLAGASGNAGHIGQLRLEPPRPDGPADSGTLEDLASGPRTVAWAQQHGWRGETGEDLAHDYAAGDRVAISAVQRSADAVGRAIAGMATVLDLESAAIGGGFMNVAPDYVDRVRASVADNVLFAYAAAVRVAPTGLAGDGPLIGAAALVLRPEAAGIAGQHAVDTPATRTAAGAAAS